MQGGENVFALNLAVNPGFETWSIGAGAVTADGALADGWELDEGAGATMSAVKDTTHQDSYSTTCMALSYSVHAGTTTIQQLLSGRLLQAVRGRAVSFGIRIHQSEIEAVRPYISVDGTKSYGEMSKVEDKYVKIFVEGIPVGAAAASVAYGIELVKAATVYADNAFFGMGGAAEEFQNSMILSDLVESTGLGFSDGEQVEFVSGTTKTLDEGDIGVWQLCFADTTVITLPATVVGATYKVMNIAPDGSALVSISPNASDKIMGNGYTSADNKDAQNTKATAKRGDYMILIADGADGWKVAAVRGTWAREA